METRVIDKISISRRDEYDVFKSVVGSTISVNVTLDKFYSEYVNYTIFSEWLFMNLHNKLIVSDKDSEIEMLESMHDNCIVELTILNESKGWYPSIQGIAKTVFDNFSERLSTHNEEAKLISVEVWDSGYKCSTYTE